MYLKSILPGNVGQRCKWWNRLSGYANHVFLSRKPTTTTTTTTIYDNKEISLFTFFSFIIFYLENNLYKFFISRTKLTKNFSIQEFYLYMSKNFKLKFHLYKNLSSFSFAFFFCFINFYKQIDLNFVFFTILLDI